jgi:hypothetical protein
MKLLEFLISHGELDPCQREIFIDAMELELKEMLVNLKIIPKQRMQMLYEEFKYHEGRN